MEPGTLAVLLSLGHGVLFVASIYIFMALFPAASATIHDRDHPHIIKQRMRGVTLSTALSLVATGTVLWRWQDDKADAKSRIAAQLGLDVHMALPSLIVSLVLMGVLFLGPLVVGHLEGGIAWDDVRRVPATLWNQPTWMRNYVVGPVAEELVFRAAVVPLWAAAGLSTALCVFASPVIFGVAHVHRAGSLYARGEGSLAAVALGTLVQLAYTTVFGWIAAGLFVRTRSIAGPIAAHVFCNVQGLPDVSKAAQHPGHKYFIWLAFGAGLAGFLVLFEPMTRPGVIIP
ncbi:CAAX prenyl protease [Coemansia sp. RSA 2711]|nr:CAAX prenyl protease [Coemansia sp. RSA 2711]KAJ2313743.1 CAAX prenyl protease [Coemansia sp. RSA 2702]